MVGEAFAKGSNALKFGYDCNGSTPLCDLGEHTQPKDVLSELCYRVEADKEAKIFLLVKPSYILR